MRHITITLLIGCLLPLHGANGQEPLGDDAPQNPALSSGRSDEMMGWTVIPSPASTSDTSRLSELERLSRSPSGVTFGLEAYDARADNPLIPVAVTLRALDKITATYRDIRIPIGEEAEFGPLTLLPRTCDKRPPDETPETTVFLEVFASGNDELGRRVRRDRQKPAPDASSVNNSVTQADISNDVLADDEKKDSDALFRGWMFASSPSLNAMEHPVYDVWVIDCKMVEPRT